MLIICAELNSPVISSPLLHLLTCDPLECQSHPCQIEDELYYPSLTWACFSLLWKSKIKKAEIENQKMRKETDDVFDKIYKSLGSSDDNLPICEELKSCMDSLSENTKEKMR